MQKPSNETISMDRDYKKNVDLSIELNRWILKLIGVWPVSLDDSPVEKLLKQIANLICYGLISFLLIPCGLYTIFEVEDVYDKIKLTGPMSFCVMAILKYYSLIVHGDDIRKCIDYIETDWKNVRHDNDRRIMIENANFGRKLVIICAFFLYSGAVFFYIAVPARVGKVTSDDENLTFIPMVYPVSRYLIDTRHSPTNEIFFSIQCLTGFLAHTITAGACSLAAAFAMHAYGQMDVLISLLEELVDGRSNLRKDVNDRFADIVKHHVRTLSFITLTEKVLTHISLVEVFGCTLNMCFLGYYVLMEWDPSDVIVSLTYLILLVSLTFNIFIFCYIGELVVQQCTKIGVTSYMTEWYRLPRKTSLGLVLIISQSHSSTKLTAGSLIDLSLTSFSDVVKSALTYLNMLRTLTA